MAWIECAHVNVLDDSRDRRQGLPAKHSLSNQLLRVVASPGRHSDERLRSRCSTRGPVKLKPEPSETRYGHIDSVGSNLIHGPRPRYPGDARCGLDLRAPSFANTFVASLRIRGWECPKHESLPHSD